MHKNGNSKDFIDSWGDVDTESSKFETRKWCVINDQNNTDYGEGSEEIKPSNLKPKLLNQAFLT